MSCGASEIIVPYLDLRVSDPEERVALIGAFTRVLDHGRFVEGRELDAFETKVADACDRRYCVGVGSGTSALMLALQALGVGPGDEVIVPCLSFVGTANAVRSVGAEPVFADIRDDLNIDPESVQSLLSPKVKALLPVHYGGLMCDMDALVAIAQESGLLLIEDAAQAFGAKSHGRPAGSFGMRDAFH